MKKQRCKSPHCKLLGKCLRKPSEPGTYQRNTNTNKEGFSMQCDRMVDLSKTMKLNSMCWSIMWTIWQMIKVKLKGSCLGSILWFEQGRHVETHHYGSNH